MDSMAIKDMHEQLKPGTFSTFYSGLEMRCFYSQIQVKGTLFSYKFSWS